MVQFGRARRNAIANPVQRDRLQYAVARQAAGKRADAARQIEALYDGGGLQAAVRFAYPVTARYGRALQKSAVARQKDAMAGGADGSNLRVGGATAIERVEAEHAQIGGELAEVYIEDEGRVAQRLGPDTKLRSDIDRLEHRIDGDAIVVADEVREIDGLAVGEDEVDLGVGHTETLDHVFDRGRRVKGALQCRLTLVRREMIVQLGVEAKGGARWPGHTPMLAPLPFSVLLSDSNNAFAGEENPPMVMTTT